MALTGWSAANHLVHAAHLLNRPVLASIWAWRPDLGNNEVAIGAARDPVHAQLRLCGIGAGASSSLMRTVDVGAAGSIVRVDSAAVPNEAWYMVTPGWIADDLREMYGHDGTRTENTTSASPSDLVQTIIGGPVGDTAARGATPWFNTGAIAEVAIWDADGMSQADRTALDTALRADVDGTYPNALQVNAQTGEPYTGKLLHYWSLRTTADIVDLEGEADMTMEGTLTAFASHPPVAEAAEAGPTAAHQFTISRPLG